MPAADPNCKHCHGSGRMEEDITPPHPPVYSRCRCMLRGDIELACKRIHPQLWNSPRIDNSPLQNLTDTCVVFSASPQDFFAHLRHVVMRQPLTWLPQLTSDAELVTAWLGSIALEGKDILDPDAYAVSTKFVTLPDLVVPSDLLIIRMGVKTAPNRAAPDVFAEALQLRNAEGRPTWVWDNPTNPLGIGHLLWSDMVGWLLSGYKKVSLASSVVDKGSPHSAPTRTRMGTPPAKKTLR